MRNRIAPKGARRQSGRPENQAAEGTDPLAHLSPLRRARVGLVKEILEREGDVMTLEFLRRRALLKDCLRHPFEVAVDDLARAGIVTVTAESWGVIVRRVRPATAGGAA